MDPWLTTLMHNGMFRDGQYWTSGLQEVQELVRCGLQWRTAVALHVASWTSNWCVQLQELGLSKRLSV